MTLAKIEPNTTFRNFLRKFLTDINASRANSTQWIFDDFPRLTALGNATFPRVSVVKVDENADPLGIFEDDEIATITLQVDVWTKKDHMNTLTTTDEALGTMASTVNSNRFTYQYVPTTVTNVQHDASSYGTVTIVDDDADFTAPGSLSANTVEVSKATGNLNFSSADVSSHDGEAITSTSVKKLEGEDAAKHISNDIRKAVKNNWRTESINNGTFLGLFYPLRVGGPRPLPLDEELGVYRYNIDYTVQSFNTGEGL